MDDNLFTNAMAAWQLRKAASLIDNPRPVTRVGATTPRPARNRCRGRRVLATVAGRVALHRNSTGVWEQHAGFFELEPIDLARFQPRNSAMYDIIGERGVERSQVVKQADVVMAMASARRDTRRRGQGANSRLLRPRTDHGSSLSLAIHSLPATRLGLRPGV